MGFFSTTLVSPENVCSQYNLTAWNWKKVLGVKLLGPVWMKSESRHKEITPHQPLVGNV